MSRKECCEKFIAPHRNALTAHAAAYFFCIKDKSPSEIAEIMDLPESKVRAMIQKWLKNALNAEYGLSRMSDSIDRQAAIEAFDCCELTPDGGIDANDAIDILEHLPPAQPDLDRIYAELSKAYNVEGLPDEAIGIIGDFMLSLELPSVQPEIVRCKDCKHWHREIHNGIEYVNFNYCKLDHYGDGHNFYCADAERRADDVSL